MDWWSTARQLIGNVFQYFVDLSAGDFAAQSLNIILAL